MTKRNPQADLAWINAPDVYISPKVREICDHAIRRALAAEEEVKRLRSAIESARDDLSLVIADETIDREAWVELALEELEKALEVRE